MLNVDQLERYIKYLNNKQSRTRKNAWSIINSFCTSCSQQQIEFIIQQLIDVLKTNMSVPYSIKTIKLHQNKRRHCITLIGTALREYMKTQFEEHKIMAYINETYANYDNTDWCERLNMIYLSYPIIENIELEQSFIETHIFPLFTKKKRWIHSQLSIFFYWIKKSHKLITDEWVQDKFLPLFRSFYKFPVAILRCMNAIVTYVPLSVGTIHNVIHICQGLVFKQDIQKLKVLWIYTFSNPIPIEWSQELLLHTVISIDVI